MQLAITLLGNKTDGLVTEVLTAISTCQCSIVDFRPGNLTDITSIYAFCQRFQVQVNTMRPAEQSAMTAHSLEGIPYTLETISVEKKDLLHELATFLVSRGIVIDEITASLHPAMLFNNPVFSTRFTLLVPPEVRILSLREEFLDFCDGLNIDAILEPIKR
jgi:glycine cleavage system transcriptional repressor